MGCNEKESFNYTGTTSFIKGPVFVCVCVYVSACVMCIPMSVQYINIPTGICLWAEK